MSSFAPVDAIVRLRRPQAYVDTGAAYRVLVDGKPRGKIRNNSELTLEVAPGHHELQMRYLWCRSPAMPFDTGPGEEAEFVCRPVNPGNPVAIFYRMVFARKHYMELSR